MFFNDIISDTSLFGLSELESLLNPPCFSTKKRGLSDISNQQQKNKRQCLAESNVFDTEKRNARERNRVKRINEEFQNLQRVLCVNGLNESLMEDEDVYGQENVAPKRVSKLKILRLAIQRIQYLSEQLLAADEAGISQNYFKSEIVEQETESEADAEMRVEKCCCDFFENSSSQKSFSRNSSSSSDSGDSEISDSFIANNMVIFLSSFICHVNNEK